MNKSGFVFLVLSFISLVSCSNAAEDINCEEQLYQAKKKVIALTESLNCLDTLSVEQAYQAQKRLVALYAKDGQIQGFKAATTSSASQELLNINELTSGVLFHAGVKASGDTIYLSQMVGPKIETELGFRFKRQIDKELSVEEVKQNIGVVLPVLEIPDLIFENLKAIKGPQFIASNAFASHVVVGMAKWAGNLDLDSISVALYNNGEEINIGMGSDVLEGQWETLTLLVNQLVKQGYTIEPHHILITGSLGKLLPLKVGTYRAEYSALGELVLEVKP